MIASANIIRFKIINAEEQKTQDHQLVRTDGVDAAGTGINGQSGGLPRGGQLQHGGGSGQGGGQLHGSQQ